MSEKTKELLDKLKAITAKEPKEEMAGLTVSSNLGEDRLYSNLQGTVHLINKDNTRYRGKIHRRSITTTAFGGPFRSHVYETDDGRWFDRSGRSIPAPGKIDNDDAIISDEEK